MEYVIDRFEGEYAVIETDINTFVNIPKILVEDAKEGDIIRIEILKDKTDNKKEIISNLMNELFVD